MHFAVERLDVFDLLRQIETVREPHITEIRDTAKLVGIQIECEIERPHEARSVADLARAHGALPAGSSRRDRSEHR